MSQVSPAHRARATDHAVRRYAERTLGVAVEADDDRVVVTELRDAGVNVGRIRSRLSELGGIVLAHGATTCAVIAEGLKLVVQDGAVVTVLAPVIKLRPAGPSSPVRRQRTCLDMEASA